MDVDQQQRMRREGLGQRQVGEHFTWRYADHRFKANRLRDFTPVALLERTPHLRMYLELLQVAGLIRIFENVVTADPPGRGGSVRLARAAIVRSVEHRRKLVVEGSVATTGKTIRHGTHSMALPECLEAGRISASSIIGFRGFTAPGVYGCYEFELTVCLYATLFHVTAFNETQCEDGPAAWWQYQCAQVFLRGEKTVEGARQQTTRSMGEDVQQIYPDHKDVTWSALGSGYVLEGRITTCLLQLLPALTAAGGRHRPRALRF